MIIAKFGGSSVASINNAKNIKNIVQQNSNIKFVVVSAIGKSEKYTQKVTDLLYKLYLLYVAKQDYKQTLDDIFDRYINLAKELKLTINFDKQKQNIVDALKANLASKAYIVSRGEYLSALLYSKFLQGQFLDASEYIIFKSNGEINYKQTQKRLKSLASDNLYVIGGFYGASTSGKIKVFDRGGSDITGAIIAKVLDAEIYQNYTDVDGVFDKNPRIFNNANMLPILSYKTAYGMADAGNEVVHKTALKVLKQTNTVLIVKNTNNTDFGTVVTSADYILKKLLVCKTSVKVLKFLNITQEIKSKLATIGRLKRIVKHNAYFYALFEELYIAKNKIFETIKPVEIFDAVMFTLFENIQICNKNIKKISKMCKKIKKHAIFSKFFAYKNNFVILAKHENNDKIITKINSYLQ